MSTFCSGVTQSGVQCRNTVQGTAWCGRCAGVPNFKTGTIDQTRLPQPHQQNVSATVTPDNEPAPISTERMWTEGRRIYVKCGYQSELNNQLRNLGAKWDRDMGALWIGTGKRDLVEPLVQAHETKIAAIETKKASGIPTKVPYKHAAVATAKRLGGIWNQETKMWVMPTQEAADTVQQEIFNEKTKTSAAERKKKNTEFVLENLPARLRSEGWVMTETEVCIQKHMPGYMRRPEAEASAPQVGDVRKRKDGTFWVVKTSTVYFLDDDGAADFGIRDEKGWYWDGTGVIVENIDPPEDY